MALHAAENEWSDGSALNVTLTTPNEEMTSGVANWWALHMEATASAVAAAGAIAADASKARDPFELLTMMPTFAASAATVFQRYVRKAFRISRELDMELAIAAAPFAQEVERMMSKFLKPGSR